MKRLLRFRRTLGWTKCTYANVTTAEREQERCHQVGLLVNWQALWVGAHYSTYAKRWCVNLLPCVTVWWTKPGGRLP